MKIAGTEVSLEVALEAVQKYAMEHPATLEIFDGVGEHGYKDEHPNEITLADIGRLVVINAQLAADDVPTLLNTPIAEALAAVPVDASLEDCEPGTDLWRDASHLYSLLDIKNIGPAKRSKLLHAKRPRLVFISDSVTGAKYETEARRIASESDFETAGFWQAARADILQDEFRELMSEVAKTMVDGITGKPTLESLSSVRVLDIVCWGT